MSRFIFSISVISILLIASFISILGIKNTKQDVFTYLDNAVIEVKADKTDDAKENLSKAYDVWINKQKALTFFIDDNDIHEVTLILTGLENLIGVDESKEFFYEIHRAKTAITQIYVSQLPTLQSIF